MGGRYERWWRLAVSGWENIFWESAAGNPKPTADGRNADTRMADALVAVTRHLKKLIPQPIIRFPVSL